MKKHALVLSLSCLAALPLLGETHLTGPLAARFDALLAKHVAATDVDTLVRPFAPADEKHGRWQSEFWGKWMHSANLWRPDNACRLWLPVER